MKDGDIGSNIQFKVKPEDRKGEKLVPPGTLRMTNCPIRRIWIGSIEGCQDQE